MVVWNKTTWYSKLAAIIIFFGIVPAVSFYAGSLYEAALKANSEKQFSKAPFIKTEKSPVSVGKNSKSDYIGEVTCKDFDSYFVLTHPFENPGEAILVKKKSNTNQKIDCIYTVAKDDFEIKNDAEYFTSVEGDYLITDKGTGPVPRELGVYNLNTKKRVFDDMYSIPVVIKDGAITYWRSLTEEVDANNCPKLEEYKKQGLGSEIQAKVTLTLADMSVKELGEKRCAVIQ